MTEKAITIFVINVGGVIYYQDIELLKAVPVAVGAMANRQPGIQVPPFRGALSIAPGDFYYHPGGLRRAAGRNRAFPHASRNRRTSSDSRRHLT